MRFQNLLKYIPMAVLAGTLSSCDNDFGDMNTDKLNPTNPMPDQLFTSGLYYFGDGSARQWFGDHYRYLMPWFQYAVPNSGNQFTMFDVNQEWTANNRIYQHYVRTGPNFVATIDAIDNMPEADRNRRQYMKAMARTMIIFHATGLGDTFGDVPFTEAMTGREDNPVFTPKYDKLEELYPLWLSELKTLKDNLNADHGEEQISFGKADVIYNGDVDNWKKFINSIRLRLATRLLKVDEAKAREVITEVLADADGVISTNEDNFRLNYGDKGGPSRDGFQSLRATAPFIDFLSETNDPRLKIYFTENDYSEENCEKLKLTYNPDRYVGGPVSPDDAEDSRFFIRRTLDGNDVDTLSYLNPHLFHPTWNGATGKMAEVFLSAAEVSFIRAELAKRGITGENAQDLYEQGIRQSITMYDVILKDLQDPKYKGTQTADIDAYLENPTVKYNDAKGLEQIMTQAYIHFLKDPHQTWVNWRRTGLPNADTDMGFDPFVIKASQKELPRRFAYWDETPENQPIQRAAIERQDYGDGYYGRLWWDK
ncbi:hypothetical protein FUAX_14830 [Fulvitalea axinellae]|uniref:SusD/RagB family nutrient-binding outer membrane lipoprotein n=1 Tax=Fulvitalea axinellae TaxID=1182444 RepID=A0AAU9CA73_9BACT|nr:hypothetical protein FUAX_14830 [Fulvitalea axinellae]